MEEKKFLENYTGQNVKELIELEENHRIDSIVLAFEQAIAQKAAKVGMDKLTRLEKAILAIEALEREVNNGGFDQFFVNTGEYAAYIVESLQYVGLAKTSKIAQKAIDELGIDDEITVERVEEAIHTNDDERVEVFGTLDDAFFGYEEDISGVLFDFIKSHQDEIRLE